MGIGYREDFSSFCMIIPLSMKPTSISDNPGQLVVEEYKHLDKTLVVSLIFNALNARTGLFEWDSGWSRLVYLQSVSIPGYINRVTWF